MKYHFSNHNSHAFNSLTYSPEDLTIEKKYLRQMNFKKYSRYRNEKEMNF